MTPHASRLTVRALLLGSGLLLLSAGAASAQGTHVNATINSDSAWIIPRVPAGTAGTSLRTRDGQVVVLLMDTTLVLQFTDLGLKAVRSGAPDSVPQGLGRRMMEQMIVAAIGTLFDHGMAYRLSALREARGDGTRLVLVDREGHRVFDNVNVNGRDVMSDFAPAEAARFATAVNRAIKR